MRVILSWVPSEAGGRRLPPQTLNYAGVAKFPDLSSKSEATAWSVLLEFDTVPQIGVKTAATMKFLFDSAPVELAQVGVKFILIEGKMQVAEGQVIESNE